MAFFLGEMNNKFVKILRLNSPNFYEKFVIYQRKKVALNLIKDSSHDDCFRGETRRKIAEKYQFRQEISFSCGFSPQNRQRN